MSKLNFHQCITEANKHGFAVSLTQTPLSESRFEWECELVNEKGHEISAIGEMPLPAITAAINQMHSDLLSQGPVEEECDLV